MSDNKAVEPISLNDHSGGMIDVICAKRDGRCGRGRVSTRKATFVGSRIEGALGGVGTSFECLGSSRRGEEVWGIDHDLEKVQQCLSTWQMVQYLHGIIGKEEENNDYHSVRD